MVQPMNVVGPWYSWVQKVLCNWPGHIVAAYLRQKLYHLVRNFTVRQYLEIVQLSMTRGY